MLQDKLEIINKEKSTDSRMELGMRLLQRQFPAVLGLETPLLVQSFWGFSVQSTNSLLIVQIHNTLSDPWVTSTRADFGDDFVTEFDSLLFLDNQNKPRMTQSLQRQLANIYRSSERELPVLYPDMSRQYNSVDCGLYALATATDICFGANPSHQSYIALGMRELFDWLIDLLFNGTSAHKGYIVPSRGGSFLSFFPLSSLSPFLNKRLIILNKNCKKLHWIKGCKWLKWRQFIPVWHEVKSI